MQHHLISPTPTVLEESHFKVKLEFDPLSQSFNKLSKPCAVVSTELFFGRLGCSLPPPSTNAQEAQELSLSCTRAIPAKQRSCPSPLCCKQFNLPAKFFQPCIHQLSPGNTPCCWCHTTPLQAITLGSATIFPWPLLGFTHSLKTSFQCL